MKRKWKREREVDARMHSWQGQRPPPASTTVESGTAIIRSADAAVHPAFRGAPSARGEFARRLDNGSMVLSRARRALMLCALAGCSPALDWREFRPAGLGIQVSMPCQPVRAVREVALVARPVRIELFACSAAGDTWGLATADVTDPNDVAPALRGLAMASRPPGAGDAQDLGPARVTGATPFEHARLVRSAGRTADGEERVGVTQVFASGTRVFQMSVLTDGSRPQAVTAFMDSARIVQRP